MSHRSESPVYSKPFQISRDIRQYFELLCSSRSVDALRALMEIEFTNFVAFLFLKAGYLVQLGEREDSADIYLFDHAIGNQGPKLTGAVITKQSARAHLIHADAVAQLMDLKQSYPELTAYFISSGEFSPAAYEDAGAIPGARLVNGERLARYVDYVTNGLSYRQPLSLDVLFTADRIVRKLPTRTTVLAIANNRGGVGKTTSAIGLALVLSQLGKRVLMVDTDSQFNLSSYMGIGKNSDTGLVDHQSGKLAMFSGIKETRYPNIWIVPVHEKERLRVRSEAEFVTELHECLLDQSGHTFDWVIIDTAPALDAVTWGALASSHYVLAPVRMLDSSLIGLNNLTHALIGIQGLMGGGAHLIGCIVTQWQWQDEEALMQFEQYLLEQGMALYGVVPMLSLRHEATLQDEAALSHAYSQIVEQLLAHVPHA